MLSWMKSNCCVPLLNIQICDKAATYVIDLILTQFSPFDIDCKKINLMQNPKGGCP